MANAATAEYTDTSGQNAENASGRKHKPNLRPTNPATTSPTHPNSGDQAKIHSKLVCQICDKVGHSGRECYYRNTTTSAYRSVPYPKQSTEENRQFRRDLKQTNCRIYNANELSHTTNDETDNAEETERHDDVEDPKNF